MGAGLGEQPRCHARGLWHRALTPAHIHIMWVCATVAAVSSLTTWTRFVVLTGWFAAAWLVAACRNGEDPARVPPAPTTAEVVLHPVEGGEVTVKVRIARTEAERSRGLMHVQSMGENEGMLFLMGSDEVQSFWMKNTLIPLDMIFIDAGMTVVGIVENAEPLTTTGRSVDEPSRYVLEVNGGWSGRHGVGKGTTVRFRGVR